MYIIIYQADVLDQQMQHKPSWLESILAQAHLKGIFPIKFALSATMQENEAYHLRLSRALPCLSWGAHHLKQTYYGGNLNINIVL